MSGSRVVSGAQAFAGQAQRAAIAHAQLLSASVNGRAVANAQASALVNSYTAPTEVLTASDAGSDATIAIADHDRVYPNSAVPNVSLAGLAAVTALAYSTAYYLYYDDPTFADTAPAVLATTVAADAQNAAAPGRHSLGAITTPAAAGGPVSGGGLHAPGGGIIP